MYFGLYERPFLRSLFNVKCYITTLRLHLERCWSKLRQYVTKHAKQWCTQHCIHVVNTIVHTSQRTILFLLRKWQCHVQPLSALSWWYMLCREEQHRHALDIYVTGEFYKHGSLILPGTYIDIPFYVDFCSWFPQLI